MRLRTQWLPRVGRRVWLVLVVGASILVAIDAGALYRRNTALAGSIVGLKTFQYGAFRPIVFYRALGVRDGLSALPVIPQRALLLFLDDSAPSQGAALDWSARLHELAALRPLTVVLIPVAGAVSSVPLARSLADRSIDTVVVEARDPLALAVRTGLNNLPTAVAHSGDRLECVLSGRSSIATIAKCLSRLRGPTIQADVLIEYTPGTLIGHQP